MHGSARARVERQRPSGNRHCDGPRRRATKITKITKLTKTNSFLPIGFVVFVIFVAFVARGRLARLSVTLHPVARHRHVRHAMHRRRADADEELR